MCMTTIPYTPPAGMLTLQESAKALGISLTALYNLMRSDSIPVVRPSKGRIYIRASDIEARLQPHPFSVGKRAA